MRFRYVGPEDQIDLPIPGACIACPKGEWMDATEEAEAVFVQPDHIEVVVRGLIGSPDWEVDLAAPKTEHARKPKTEAAKADDQEQDA